MSLIDCSKWFNEPTFMNPDMINNVHLHYGGEFSFYANQVNGYLMSKRYPTKNDCIYAMNEFIKKIEGEI